MRSKEITRRLDRLDVRFKDLNACIQAICNKVGVKLRPAFNMMLVEPGEELTSADLETRWIPCKDRPPTPDPDYAKEDSDPRKREPHRPRVVPPDPPNPKPPAERVPEDRNPIKPTVIPPEPPAERPHGWQPSPDPYRPCQVCGHSRGYSLHIEWLNMHTNTDDKPIADAPATGLSRLISLENRFATIENRYVSEDFFNDELLAYRNELAKVLQVERSRIDNIIGRFDRWLELNPESALVAIMEDRERISKLEQLHRNEQDILCDRMNSTERRLVKLDDDDGRDLDEEIK